MTKAAIIISADFLKELFDKKTILFIIGFAGIGLHGSHLSGNADAKADTTQVFQQKIMMRLDKLEDTNNAMLNFLRADSSFNATHDKSQITINIDSLSKPISR